MKTQTIYRLAFFLRFILGVLTIAILTESRIEAGQNGSGEQTILETASPEALKEIDRLSEVANKKNAVKVIIGFKTNAQPLSARTAREEMQAQSEIAQTREAILDSLASSRFSNIKKFNSIPFVALEVDSDGLNELLANPAITSLEEDKLFKPVLDSSVPTIDGDLAWEQGFTGLGQTVAIIDTGIERTHDFLSGKLVSEACYSTTYSSYKSTSFCPGGVSESTILGAGSNCPSYINGCEHGTHVAGIAVGYSPTLKGVAYNANLISIQVYSRFDNTSVCGSSVPCIAAYMSDILKGLTRVYELRNAYSIASANLSLGAGLYSSFCDSSNTAFKTMIDNLASVGIATVIASGNNSAKTQISSPACISSAISVGSTTDDDQISYFSNVASFLDLLAPGSFITSSVLNNSFNTFQGTSMSAPHVSGAWAVIKEKAPTATVSQVLNAFRATGQSVDDARLGGVITDMKRIDLDNALTLFDVTLGDALDNTALDWKTISDKIWYGQRVVFYYDADAARSGKISDNQTSTLETTVSGPGVLSFYWKVSSEPNYDYLGFYIDGKTKTKISGNIDWRKQTYTIPYGTHTLAWKYSKDKSVASWSDTGWLDQVVYTQAIANSNIIVAADFDKRYGLWTWNETNGWQKAHKSPTLSLGGVNQHGIENLPNSADAYALIASFSSFNGIWKWTGSETWSNLSNRSASSIVKGNFDGVKDVDLIAGLANNLGTWSKTDSAGWQKIHTLSTKALASANLDGVGNDDIIASFSRTGGLWTMTDTQGWNKINKNNPLLFVTADMDGNEFDDIVVCFNMVNGLWIRYDSNQLEKIHDSTPRVIAAGNLDGTGYDDLVIGFAPHGGLWTWTDAQGWKKIHKGTANAIATANLDNVGNDDLIVSFVDGSGLWVYTDVLQWQKLHPSYATKLAVLLSGSGI
jgi:subtilisin family serine protease